MSVNINLESINELKKKAKRIGDEASDYEFGFDAPPRKKSATSTAHVFAVPAKNSHRRHSIFFESDQYNNNGCNETLLSNLDINNLNQIDATEISTENCPIEVIVIPSAQTNGALDETDKSAASIQFQLNDGTSEEQSLIHTLMNSENPGDVEPLLFRNQYFKILDKQNNFVNAMCINCGLDENNQPKKIIRAQAHVSSNFISHLKVTLKLNIIRFS